MNQIENITFGSPVHLGNQLSPQNSFISCLSHNYIYPYGQDCPICKSDSMFKRMMLGQLAFESEGSCKKPKKNKKLLLTRAS